MREILFRGRRKKGDKRWVEGYLTYGYADYVGIVNRCCAGTSFEVVPETVGQYTGMKDKNGVRVFEGDIIITDNKWKNQGYSVVKYSDENTAFVLECQHSGEMLGEPFGMNYFSNNIEVIGNIYDNPELLEGDKT